MKSKLHLDAKDIKTILQQAEEEALRQQFAVTIAVVDDGGMLLGLHRMDGAPPISAYAAPAKAQTAALGRRESKVYEDLINSGRTSILSLPIIEGMMQGGIPIMVDGECVGAVGVSGVQSHQDAQIAEYGIRSLTR